MVAVDRQVDRVPGVQDGRVVVHPDDLRHPVHHRLTQCALDRPKVDEADMPEEATRIVQLEDDGRGAVRDMHGSLSDGSVHRRGSGHLDLDLVDEHGQLLGLTDWGTDLLLGVCLSHRHDDLASQELHEWHQITSVIDSALKLSLDNQEDLNWYSFPPPTPLYHEGTTRLFP